MIPVFRPAVTDSLREAVVTALDSQWWGYGPRCHELEARFAAAWEGTALATSSCTSSLYLAATAIAHCGKEVIVPAITFASTAVAFAHAGFRVIVADVDPRTLMMTSATVEPLLTRDTAGVVAVHLYGQRCGLEDLAALCRRRGVPLIEDRAHRIGLADPPVGEFACLSFNAVKELPVGEGGLLWCRDEVDALACRRVSYLGMDVDQWTRSRSAVHREYEISGLTGLKLRMHDLSAALALAGMQYLEAHAARRRRIYDVYRESGARWWADRGENDSLLMLVARVDADQRERIRRELASLDVATSVHYPSLSSRCPVAALAAEEVMTLPSSASVADDELAVITYALRRLTSEVWAR